MQLNQITEKAGAVHNAKRIGRGIGSGTGKTGGRGVKGQKSRSGVSIKGFEGGQTPIYRRVPKRGFIPHGRKTFVLVHTGKLQEWADAKRINAKEAITADILIGAGLIKNACDGLRLLVRGDIKDKFTIHCMGSSQAARAMVEKAGGSLVTPEIVTGKKGKRWQRREDAKARHEARQARTDT